MDVTKLLKADHDRVRELFRQYKGGGGLTGLVKRVTGNVAVDEQRDALRQICREFEMHAQLEEEIFYPALKAAGDEQLRKEVDEGIEEHAQAKRLVAGLRGRLDEAENLGSEVSELESAIDHHATEEENEMFPRVQEVLPEARRAELAREIRARKKALVGSAPSSSGAGKPAKPARAAKGARTAKAKPAIRGRRAKARGGKTAAKTAARARAKVRTTRGRRGRAKTRKRA